MSRRPLYYSLLLVVVLFFMSGTQYMLGQALDPVVMDCVEIDDDGDAFFTWSAPNDPDNEFVSYDIYYSDDDFTSPATLVGNIDNILITGFEHIGAAGNSGQVCYYVLVNSNDGSPQTSMSSDTICSLYITAEPSIAPLGFANIEITEPYPYGEAASGLEYQVWLNYPIGEWNLIEFLPVDEDFYQYEVNVCEVYYEFQVILIDENGCNIRSNIAGNIFEDHTPPPTPFLEYVTVDTTTLDVSMSWGGADYPDTQGYIVYQCLEGGLSVPVDTIYGSSNTTYSYEANLGQLSGGIQFTVAAFDFCFEGSDFANISPTDELCHEIVYLENPTWFNCQDYVDLEWSHYHGWELDGGVLQYEILFQENNGPIQQAGFVDGFTNTFTHENLNLGSIYKYTIKAYSFGGLTSLSNPQTQNLQSDVPPTYAYLFSADVIGESQVDVTLMKEASFFDFIYVLERQDEPGEEFEEVMSMTSGSESDELFFQDVTAETRFGPLCYRVSVLNDCGDTVMVSNLGCTIFLNGIENSDFLYNTLYWNAYEEWDNGVDEYRIYRSEEEGLLGTVVGTVAGGDLNFEDPVDESELSASSGWFCYTVEAIEAPDNGLGDLGQARSNQRCLQMEPHIWVPNAFVVNGVNNIFMPVLNAVDTDTYLMLIFSRLGDTIYETNDSSAGWDGRKNGTLLQEGQYGYYISVKDGQGKLHERKGAFIMLHGGE